MNECDELWGVRFDADVTSVGGGAPQTQGLLPDVAAPKSDDPDPAELFVRQHGLPMVDSPWAVDRALPLSHEVTGTGTFPARAFGPVVHEAGVESDRGQGR
ncbi:hypothetical protein [Streptomyces europaeiscabiei]|uniref:hypothetical protein n=1 Tax=Streptomyces europaeiscabiei TaxID=146819 RepID=UPI0029A14EC4|nr:hypothetical protein [Streptomyces europaeiscabiei]MDX2758669.1 hypothetical protein [Streptomyces europaeiscabiei]MDX3859821.1 hypothetical protein [Streptomyces europaeiscabiei]MDX3870029.1 hypothetical protein [Streptomyces europaeiscabiei]